MAGLFGEVFHPIEGFEGPDVVGSQSKGVKTRDAAPRTGEVQVDPGNGFEPEQMGDQGGVGSLMGHDEDAGRRVGNPPEALRVVVQISANAKYSPFIDRKRFSLSYG